ncbi:MAG TPA: carboxypeptidase regulatory-like domain-containing protein, partial [Pyrinomonadaceae bacterium]
MRLEKIRPSRRAAAASKPVSILRGRWLGFASTILLLCVVSAQAVQTLQTPAGVGGGAQGRGSRSAGVQPKRATRRDPAQAAAKTTGEGRKAQGPSRALLETSSPNSLGRVLAMADFDVIGLAATASPATQTVPKNTPTAVLASVEVPEGGDPAAIIAGLNPNYRVRGELTGPSLASPLVVEARLGEPLNIPALSRAGDHVLQNLRVVDTGLEGEAVVAPVTPDSCGIVVIDRLLISEVRVNELTYDQIVQAGINITDDSYRAFNFTLGVGTSSDAQPISIPVAFPAVGAADPRPVVGVPSLGVGSGVPIPDVIPIMLEIPEGEGAGQDLELEGEGPIRIPGVIVFPGRVGLLHQFFEAIVIVANGAPNGTPLVVRGLRAKAKLPDGGTPDPSDDPLRVAETQTGGRVSDLEIHGLGPDGRYGTGDDTDRFTPGQSGQATFLLEGMKEGLHTVNFELEGTLEGLPRGPVTVRGEVPGAVLVRDASFAVTFTHPSVVRAGQEYDLAMTMYNSGQRDIQGAFASLSRNSISGASFATPSDTGRRDFQTTVKRGQSATVKWRLRASTTGAVTASYVKVDGDVSAGLALVTGVGDRNVPLSPESLVLPDPVAKLPSDVVEAARAVLGQAWGVANAPAGSLPQGVAPVSKQAVIDRAVELGVAGMRVDFGEPISVSLETLVRDWLGELNPDDGFADVLRDTPSGYVFFDTVGSYFARRLGSAEAPTTPVELHRELANAESPRSPFVSALVTQAAGAGVFGARLVNPQGGRVGFGESAGERAGELAQGAAMNLALTDAGGNVTGTAGQLLLASNPGAGEWQLELFGRQAGAADVSLLVPAGGRSYRQVVFGGVQFAAGAKYRVKVRPGSPTAPVLEEFRDGAYHATAAAPSVETLGEPAPRLVGAIQVTPDVVSGGDRYGRLLGLLFSKPMAREQAEAAANYRVGGGALKGSNPPRQVGGQINVRSARLDLGSRFVFISLDAPFGPYIDRDIDVSNLRDARGALLAAAPAQRVEPRVSPQGNPPGAYLTGRVMSADGTPVAGAQVVYWTQPCDDGKSLFGGDEPVPVALRQTGADGLYAFDYVRNGDCGPLFVTVTNPVTRSTKKLTTPVIYDGQHMTLDLVFLARGKVSGTVTSGGRAVPNAFVRVVPELDVVGSKVVQTDAQGNYAADDIPVGNVSVAAAGTGAFSNATGLAAGTITGPGRTAFVNVSMQNVSGAVSGRVVNPDQSPVPGALVVAYAPIAGFQSDRPDGYTAVGYVYASRDGGFRLENLPVGDIKIEVTDYVTGLKVGQAVQLSNERPELHGLLIAVPGYGSVTGTVTDDTGTFVPEVIVSGGGITVRADALGQYTLPNLRPGTQAITALDPVSRMTGTTVVPVRLGETTSGANITVTRPAAVTGRVTRLGGATETPVSGVIVTNDGTNFTTTDAQGRYTLKNLPPNTEFILRVVDPTTRLASNLPMVLGPGANVTRDVTFRTASLHGRVTQPDGVTGAAAQVDVYVPLPKLSKGPDFGLLSSDKPISVASGGDGSYQLTGLNPGSYRATVSNGFFPTRVSKGGTLAAGQDAECNLTLVDRLAGKIQGRVFRPDGTTPVGAGIEVTLGGGSLADVTVRTDETGHYEFAEVFSEGGYALTASDTETGLKNRAYISVRFNQDAVADIRLRGLGALRVRVVDGGGNPVSGGQINLDGSDFPNARRFTSITPDLAGVVLYDGLPEGNYAVAASQNGLGGRASAAVTLGSTVEITVKLQASGTVEGRVSMPGGTTHVGLADVQLFAGGRAIGFTTTDDTDAARGSFSFVGVPAGDFTVDVLDNRTGRVGRGHGRITQQGETANVNVELLPVGRVTGRVTANGQPVDHALVEISADASGLRHTRLQATTDPEGRYSFTGIPVGRFNLRVTNAPGGQTGAASGTVSGNTEPLPDTVVDITLEPSATVTGAVYRAGGTEPLPGARVTLFAGSRRLETATNAAGVYRVSFVPLGELKVRAEAPVGFDRGEAPAVGLDAPGSTATVNVMLAGAGGVTGEALDSNGARLAAGTVTMTNDAWGSPLVFVAPVQPSGRYEITGVPAGAFTLKLTVSNRVGIGTTGGVVVAGQSLELPVQIEDAGSATGTIVAPDGVTAVRGADITLTLARAGKPSLRFYTNTNAQGVWSLENLPLGAVSVAVSDVVSGGVARATNLPLSTNGQRLDVGRMVLDNTPIRVELVTPADGAAGVSPTSPRSVAVTFSEPADPATVHAGTVRLLRGASGVGAGVTLSADGRTATLTASGRLADSTAYTVLVSGVSDPTGHALANEFRSTFTTSDETGPSVAGVTPAAESAEVALDSAVVVTFDEPVDRAQDFGGLVRLLSGPAPGEPAAGAVTLDESGKVATFRAAGGLALSRRYTVSVAGVRDLAGNVQPAAFTSRFVSLNPAPSVSLDEPAEGAQWTEGQTVRLAATAADNTAVARVLFKVNGATVGASSAAPYAVNYTVPVGQVGSVNVEAVAEDDLSRTTSAARAVTVAADPVPTVTLTSPAEGTQLIEGQTVGLAATASDNGSVARVVFAANGSALGADTSEPYAQTFTVPAGVTSVSLSAQAFDNLGKNATDTRSFTVVPDPGTTVRGRVVNNTGQPVPNASVSVFDAYTATTGADGRFTIAGVPTVRGDIAARATATINARAVTTVSEARAPEPRATTELGDITLAVMQFESDLGALANFGGSNDDNSVPVDLPFA